MGLSQENCNVVPASVVAQKPPCQLTAVLLLKSCRGSMWLHGGSYNTLIKVVSEHCIISKVLEDE